MKKISDFDKNYALFAPYVTDEQTRSNMLANDDLKRKYKEYIGDIKPFIEEIARRFDVETVFDFIKEVIFKLPDEILKSFITAYLHSDEAAKNNPDVVKFYNKTLNLGSECVAYIEKYGIITNRGYRDLPVMVVDKEYEEYRKNNEIYKNEILYDVYKDLNLNERKLVVGLLKADAFRLLNNLFAAVDLGLCKLLALLLGKSIDAEIINQEVADGLGEYNLLVLILSVFQMEDAKRIVENIKALLREKRFEITSILVTSNNLISLNEYTKEMLVNMNDQEIMDELTKKGYNLVKKGE